METLTGRTALVTGASRGLGRHIAGALASEGMDVVLAARSAGPLRELAAALEGACGVRATAVPADLTVRGEVEELARSAEDEQGGVDVLVNNAGVTNSWPYHLRNPEEIGRGVELNLLAPMLLARRLLPGMVERGRGHVVNMASLAGKAGPPYEAVYGATKAGLIGFTQSLRREYHDTDVGASAICPGYVRGTGMYADGVEETGVEAPKRVGRTTPDDVARAVVRAVREDVPEILVNSTPVRPMLVLSEASPRLGEWMGRALGLFRAFERGAERAMEDADDGSPETPGAAPEG
jgi:short-subunit dehydrogenase